MTVSTWFEGEPESCRRVARRLDALAETLAESGRFLGTQAALDPDDFEGLSGEAYRRSTGRLCDDAAGTAAAQRAVARALDAFATGLDGVRRVLRRARDLAAGDLVVTGTDIHRPGPGATERQREVFRMVQGAVREARLAEDRAHHDWQAALAAHAGTRSPSPLAAGPSGLPLPHPMPEPLPPADRPVEPPADPQERVTGATTTASPAPTARPAATPAPPPPGPDWETPPADDWAPAGPVPIEWELSDGPR